MSVEAKIREAEPYQAMGLLKESLSAYESLLKDLDEKSNVPKSDIENKIKAIEREIGQKRSGFPDMPIPKEFVELLKEPKATGGGLDSMCEAEALRELGLFREAVDVYLAVLKSAPDSGRLSFLDIVVDVAGCLLEIDSPEAAVAEIEKILDSWQLIKYVRERYAKVPFPIVAVSGTIVEQLDQLDQIGADFYIIRGPLETMTHQITEFLTDLGRRDSIDEKEKLMYDPGNIDPRRESAELIESLGFQKAIFESIGLGLIVVDRDGRIIQANELSIKILDRQPADMMNQLIPTVFPQSGRKQLVETMRMAGKNPDLRGVPNCFKIEQKRIRMIVSLLLVEDRQVGWIVSLEEVGE